MLLLQFIIFTSLSIVVWRYILKLIPVLKVIKKTQNLNVLDVFNGQIKRLLRVNFGDKRGAKKSEN